LDTELKTAETELLEEALDVFDVEYDEDHTSNKLRRKLLETAIEECKNPHDLIHLIYLASDQFADWGDDGFMAGFGENFDAKHVNVYLAQ